MKIIPNPDVPHSPDIDDAAAELSPAIWTYATWTAWKVAVIGSTFGGVKTSRGVVSLL